MLTNERLGRLALSSIAAVIGGIALLGICGMAIRAIPVWLVYVIVCAVLLNSKEGEPTGVLAKLAVVPSIIPLLVLSYPVLFLDEGVCFSGVKLTGKDWKFIAGFCTFLILVSWTGITLFAFGRNRLLEAIEVGASKSTVTKLKSIDAMLRTLVTVVGTLSLLFLAVTGYGGDSRQEARDYAGGKRADEVSAGPVSPQ